METFKEGWAWLTGIPVVIITYLFYRKKNRADTALSKAETRKLNTEESIMVQKEIASIRKEVESLMDENRRLKILVEQLTAREQKLIRRITILETYKIK